jgi:hypothetical protein
MAVNFPRENMTKAESSYYKSKARSLLRRLSATWPRLLARRSQGKRRPILFSPQRDDAFRRNATIWRIARSGCREAVY